MSAETTTKAQAIVHYQYGAGVVTCGARMYDYTRNTVEDVRAGKVWDMSTASVNRTEVTCPNCRANKRAPK
jgi:ribose 5-phosphate isomerase RpiB